MTDPIAVQRAREWLERQLAELGQLRNASRRDQNFKAWRQHTLTVIQRVWPGDPRRVDRFRRIPFSPPMSRSSDRQVREFYERGWGEAGVVLRELLAEINLLGLPQIEAAGARTQADGEPDGSPMPTLEPPTPERLTAGTVPPEAGDAPPPRSPESGGNDFSRAMERLLGGSSAFRRSPAPSPATAPGAGSPAAELVRLADELEAHGLDPEQVRTAREALLALASAAETRAPGWDLVGEALRHAVATPALARRALPLLLGFVEKAA